MNTGAQKKPKAAMVLSGCGVFDGTEIHEAVITLLCLLKGGAEVSFFAPDIRQSDCINHLDGSDSEGPRNVLSESARIARGKIEPLSRFDAGKFDMLLFPGGFGAAKNLCTFAYDGADCTIEPSVEKAISDMMGKGGKIAFMCISPVIGAKAIGDGVMLTIGNDKQTAAGTGAATIFGTTGGVAEAVARRVVEDKSKNVYSTPAYMLAKDAAEVEKGVSAMISRMFETL